MEAPEPDQHDEPSEASAEPAPRRARHTSPTRLEAAQALRYLAHTLVARQVDDELLTQIRDMAEQAAEVAEQAPLRPHALLRRGAEPFAPGRQEPNDNGFPDGLVSGKANPMGLGARSFHDGEEAVLQVTLGAAFEGAPGRAHGGVVATLIDETMGMVLGIIATPAFTGRLTVNYRAPTPVGEPLEVRARLVGREGRKLFITAELRSQDTLVADADALFVTVQAQNFFPPAG